MVAGILIFLPPPSESMSLPSKAPMRKLSNTIANHLFSLGVIRPELLGASRNSKIFIFPIDSGGSPQNLFLLAFAIKPLNAKHQHDGRAPPGPGRHVEIVISRCRESQKQKILVSSLRNEPKNKYFEISSRMRYLTHLAFHSFKLAPILP